MTTRVNPYSRLQRTARIWAVSVLFPTRKHLVSYRCGTPQMLELRAKIEAADKLGYDVRCSVNNGNVVYEYVQRPDPTPWEIRP